jgi:hypothetical protein
MEKLEKAHKSPQNPILAPMEAGARDGFCVKSRVWTALLRVKSLQTRLFGPYSALFPVPAGLFLTAARLPERI